MLVASLDDVGGSELRERAQGALYAGTPRRVLGNDDAIFDHDNPKIKEVSHSFPLDSDWPWIT